MRANLNGGGEGGEREALHPKCALFTPLWDFKTLGLFLNLRREKKEAKNVSYLFRAVVS